MASPQPSLISDGYIEEHYEDQHINHAWDSASEYDHNNYKTWEDVHHNCRSQSPAVAYVPHHLRQRVRSAPQYRTKISVQGQVMRGQRENDGQHLKCECHLENYSSDINKNDKMRPSSVRSVTSSFGPSNDYYPPRPSSSASIRYPPGHHLESTRSRPKSAPPSVQKLYLKANMQKQLIQAKIGSAPGPKFMDRHSHCQGYTHIHEKLHRKIPTKPCEKCGEACEDFVTGYKPIYASLKKPASRFEEYMIVQSYNKHADRADIPQLLVNLRSSFQPLAKHNHVRQGTIPHFCNFVRNKKIHERASEKPNDSGHTHLHRRFSTPPNNFMRRKSTQSRVSSSGTEGRPNSPSDVSGISAAQSGDEEMDVDVPRVEINNKSSVKVKPRVKSRPPVKRTNTLKKKSKTGATSKPADGMKEDQFNGICVTNCCGVSNSKPLPNFPSSSSYDEKRNKHSSLSNQDKQGEDDLDKLRALLEAEKRSAGDTATASEETTNQDKREGFKKKERISFTKRKSLKTTPEDEILTDLAEEPEETEPAPRPSTPPARQRCSVDVKAPDLPKLRKREAFSFKTNKKSSSGPKSAIITNTYSKPNVNEILEQEAKIRGFYNFPSSMADYKIDSSHKSGGSTWTQGRLALSQQSSRFELPMDMKLLETMEPVEYLSKYCFVTSKRQWLYEKIYLKHKDGKLGGLNIKLLEKALKEALVDTITSEEATEMIELAQLKENSVINQKLFVGMAALAERLLYPKFLTEDTNNIKDHKKEKIECADFCGLEWKFHGINVNQPMRKLLEAL